MAQCRGPARHSAAALSLSSRPSDRRDGGRALRSPGSDHWHITPRSPRTVGTRIPSPMPSWHDHPARGRSHPDSGRDAMIMAASDGPAGPHSRTPGPYRTVRPAEVRSRTESDSPRLSLARRAAGGKSCD
eukprot:290489-Hanusia_phi.AAC.1